MLHCHLGNNCYSSRLLLKTFRKRVRATSIIFLEKWKVLKYLNLSPVYHFLSVRDTLLVKKIFTTLWRVNFLHCLYKTFFDGTNWKFLRDFFFNLYVICITTSLLIAQKFCNLTFLLWNIINWSFYEHPKQPLQREEKKNIKNACSRSWITLYIRKLLT